jgi:hypothetical protein
MWPPWGYPQQQQQPFIIMPWSPQGPQSSTPADDPVKIHKKIEKQFKKWQEAQKKGQDNGSKPAPKTGMQKLSDKSLTYWEMMRWVVAVGPIATYAWSLLMIHMWNNLKDAVSTLH